MDRARIHRSDYSEDAQGVGPDSMTETVATMTAESLGRRARWHSISNVVRDVAFASALSLSQAEAGELPARRHREQTKPVTCTTDEALRFNVEPRSLAVLDDVESRSAAEASWVRELKEICSEATSQGWDGEGAAPVQQGALEYAVVFVSELAQGVRFPEVGVDPDGEVSLGWQVHDEVFSVSISGEGRLSYAGIFGTSECYGTEWMGEQVPSEVLRQLDRLLYSRWAKGRAD